MIGEKFTHYKKGGEYVVISYGLIQVNNEWVDAVAYIKVGDDKKFFRILKEFKEKFNKIK